MRERFIFTVAILLTYFTALQAADFTFIPKNGSFIEEESGIRFGSMWKGSSDYGVLLPNYTVALRKTAAVRYIGPIFPKYKLAKTISTDIDSAAKSVTVTQKCQEYEVDVKKTYSLMNGGVMAEIVFGSENSVTFDGKPRCRINFPDVLVTGKEVMVDTTPITLRADSKSRVFAGRKVPTELRFPLTDTLQLGVKIVSGASSYYLSNRVKKETNFSLFITMDGNTLRYYTCLLKPDESFPDFSAAQTETEAKARKKNLLGNGSGFEVGPYSMVPFNAYSWAEAYTSPGIAPVFDENMAYEGKYSLKLTGNNLKERRGRFYSNMVRFNPVKLDSGKTYTLSAWLKADSDNTAVGVGVSEPLGKGRDRKNFKVGTNWKRYSFTFTPKTFSLLNYRNVTIALKSQTAKLWIDGVQLEEGELGDYLPPPLEFGATIRQKFKLFDPEEYQTAAVNLYFRNNTDVPADFKLNYEIRDFWEKVITSGKVAEKVAAKGNLTTDLKLPDLPLGYYRVVFTADDDKLYDEVIFGIYQEMAFTGKLPPNWPLGCHGFDGNPLVRKLGFGWTRSWDFKMKAVMPAPDKMNFKETTDIVVERCRAAKLNLMPILGTSFSTYHTPAYDRIPEWAVAEKRHSSIKTYKHMLKFPRIDAWKTYIKTCVERYKGEVQAWEVLNEPNCWLTPEEYVPYLKAAYEAAKEVDPDCIVVGGCATSDFGIKPAPWTLKIIELTQAKFMDALAIHMYGPSAPEDYHSGMGTSRMLEVLRGAMKKYGRDLPIWHTEKNYCSPVSGYSFRKFRYPAMHTVSRNSGTNHFAGDYRLKAEWLLRETLIDSTVGKGPFFWFGAMPNDIFIMPRQYAGAYHNMENDGSPTPQLLAANGLARILEGRGTPVELVKLGTSIYCALYEGKDGVLAAIWDAKTSTTLELPRTGLEFGLYNFFGVAKAPKEKGKLEIATAPVYLTFDGTDAASVKTFLLKRRLTREVLSFSGGLESENGTAGLAVYVSNEDIVANRTDLRIDGIPDGWRFAEVKKRAVCRPGQTVRVFFPLTLPEMLAGNSTVTLRAGDTPFAINVPAFGSRGLVEAMLRNTKTAAAFGTGDSDIVIDGKLGDWDERGTTAVTAHGKPERKVWRDQADLSATLRLRWDKKHLYLAANVYDNVLQRRAPAGKSYQSDGIELFLGLDGQSKATALKLENVTGKRGRYDYQILLAPGMTSGLYPHATAWNCNLKSPAGMSVASTEFDGGYTIEAAIPWQELKKDFIPVKGMNMLFTYQIADTDSKQHPTQKKIYWAGDDSNFRSSQNWGGLVLR
jgi:hypothetical protein